MVSEQTTPAKDEGANADMMVAPCSTSLSSDIASPAAIMLRWVRGTARKPSDVTSNDTMAALRPSWMIARFVGDSAAIARWNRIERPTATALTGYLPETWWQRPDAKPK